MSIEVTEEDMAALRELEVLAGEKDFEMRV
jgi:hypothetical protein